MYDGKVGEFHSINLVDTMIVFKMCRQKLFQIFIFVDTKFQQGQENLITLRKLKS